MAKDFSTSTPCHVAVLRNSQHAQQGDKRSSTSLVAAMSGAEEMEHEAGEDEELAEAQGEDEEQGDEQGEDEQGEGEEHNEYERERAARIAENMAKLQALGVSWWCMGCMGICWAPPCFTSQACSTASHLEDLGG